MDNGVSILINDKIVERFGSLICDCDLISEEDKRGTNDVVSRWEQKIPFSCMRAQRQTRTFRSPAPS